MVTAVKIEPSPVLADLQVVIRRYYADQKMRISIENQIGAMVRRELYSDEDAELIYKEIVSRALDQETSHIKTARPLLRMLPVWNDWMSKVHGVGEVLGAAILGSGLDPERPRVSMWWSYAGLNVVEGKAPRRERGKKAAWNHALRRTMYNFGICIERSGGPYKERVYTPYKERDRAVHPEPVDTGRKDRDGKKIMAYTPGHLRMRAIRYTSKMFLSHLWQVWRETEGLPVNGPYAVERLGHVTVLSPWEMIAEEVQ